ncbi:MAG: MBL fold metallo-hydrolase, partial [Lachnospiraceae bacterium]|nr:MBL fold metallo-hydrolase [Lachnospiraceae bacterium]
MTTKITVIVDNKENINLPGEWGLSVLVEYGGKKILLDAGQTGLFLENMKGLGIDVSDIDYATLSHAHYDHANGFMQFFDKNTKAKLYLREGTDKNCYKKVSWFHAYIGIPKKLLKKHAGRIEMISGDYKLLEGVYLIPHKTPGLSEIGKREKMYQRTKHGWMFDD